MMSSGKFHSRAKIVKSRGDHKPSECNHTLHGKFIHYHPQNSKEGKEIVTYYNNDGDRQLIVRNPNPLDIPGILPRSEFQRLKKQAHVITKQDRREMMEKAERDKIMLQDESQKRKDMLNKAQLQQIPKHQSKLENVEQDACDKNQYILQRAHQLRQEQEEEVKKFNSLILATKCMAIREAQIAEKKLIKKELNQEDQRLDMMMEQQRQLAIKKEKDKKQREQEQTQRFVNQINQQMQENEMQRMVEAEKLEEESRMVNKALIQMQKEDAEKLRQKVEEQRRMQRDMKESNENIERYKRIRQEEDRIADMRVQEFMRKKAEREDAREAELMEIAAAKEREIGRLRSLQQRAQEQKSQTEELNAKREQEMVEKEWRDKQKLAAQKRKEQAEEMKRGREHQVDEIRRAQALELAREESEFHKVAKVQRDLWEKDQQKRKEKKEAAVQHRKDLLKQVNQKEREIINMHQKNFKEGEAQRLEKELRELRIKETLVKKVANMRENNVPENFVNDVARQIDSILHS